MFHRLVLFAGLGLDFIGPVVLVAAGNRRILRGDLIRLCNRCHRSFDILRCGRCQTRRPARQTVSASPTHCHKCRAAPPANAEPRPRLLRVHLRGSWRQWAKTSSSPQPPRSRATRCGRNPKQAWARCGASFALQHLVEPGFQFMQIKHILCRIGFLRVGQHMRTPVRTLLLLVGFNAHQFPQQILQAMPVGIGAGNFGGDLGAVEWGGFNAETNVSAPPRQSGRNGKS